VGRFFSASLLNNGSCDLSRSQAKNNASPKSFLASSFFFCFPTCCTARGPENFEQSEREEGRQFIHYFYCCRFAVAVAIEEDDEENDDNVVVPIHHWRKKWTTGCISKRRK